MTITAPAKPTAAEWSALARVLEDDLGLEALSKVAMAAFTPDEVARLVRGEDPGRDITKEDTAKIVRALADLHPGEREADITWAMSVAVRAWGDTDRTIELAKYARLKIEEYEEKNDPSRFNPIDSPDNRLLNPGRVIVWFGDNGGKEIHQRDTGYYAGRLGDRKAYNFEQALIDQWDAMCEIYESISGDTSMREGGKGVVAVYTRVEGYWNPSPGRSYFKDSGAKTDQVPDITTVQIVTPSRHVFKFLQRNRSDYVGEAGTGNGHVIDPTGRVRAAWSFNRTRWKGVMVGFRA